ncbi:bifunctional UDP-sugar hydrolase/5'-nucleotidase [Bulleidia sp. zg-1006]|uniref:bifunctional metallophosphatase/5'-nucleotidase n=1 Tax=Bulleidia sp. zg-1006 TaxID=2806552 RepID=UPI00193AC5DE|nr:bifunctional UDP-sugar hydrolase/5'-nucleotidase [Bulleidia sp. zg-1006]QRG86732.1 bifunctional metallophosphatase/5'-nucleotidase [Bulleidia sp. zg-1006]
MKRIRILATSDIHGTVLPTQYSNGLSLNIGLARLKTLVHSLKDEHTILVDNGDAIQGSPLTRHHYHFHADDVNPMTKAMKEMHYDFIGLGNHDFNYGQKALQTHLDHVGSPCLCANVKRDGVPLGLSYAVKEVEGVRLAFFSLVTSYTPTWESEKNIAGLEFVDAYESAKKIVEYLQKFEQPDYIICMYHGGFERDLNNGSLLEEDRGENQGYRILKEISGIDVLISGHQHRSLAGELFHTIYTQTLDKGQELALIDIYPENHHIESHILLNDMLADEAMMKLVEKEERETQKWLDTVVGHSKVDLSIHDTFQARLKKAPLVTFINRIQMETTGAQLAGSAIYDGAVGFKETITMRDIVSTYIYDNTLVVKKITGAQLKAYLEQCASYWTLKGNDIEVSQNFIYPKKMNYNYDMIDGVDYSIDLSKPVNERITQLVFQGNSVQDEEEFTIALNSYRAAGGGNFDMLKEAVVIQNNGIDFADLVAGYLENHPEIDFIPEDNIHLLK